MTAISVQDLRKAYADTEAVRGIDLDVAEGEVFCLLGPNGAGKTTTTEILEGYRTRTAGAVSVLGEDPAHAGAGWRARLGIMLQESGVQPQLTVGELLAMYGRWYPRPHRRSPEELIELSGLDAKRDTRVTALSGGQRRRLDLALALVGSPELLFLDEPITGFDPEARRQAWATIAGLTRLGTTIFLTTHFMDEAQALADRVAVVVAGRIVAAGAPGELGGRDAMGGTIRFRLPAGWLPDDLPLPAGAEVASLPGAMVQIEAADLVPATGAITAWALERGLELQGFEVVRPSLEDVYLRLVAEEAHR